MGTEADSLRSLIGGRWAVSWQGYLLAWPPAVFFLFAATPSVWQSESLAEGLVRGFVIGTAVYLPVGAVLWLASITVLRARDTRPAPIWLVALIGGIAWTARSIAMLAYLVLQGLASDVPPTQRVVAGFLQGAVALTLSAWLFATLDRFYQRRASLLNELVQQEVAADRLTSAVERMRAEVVDGVRRTVQESANALDRPTSSESPSSRDIDALDEVKQRMSRQLARDLWNAAEGTSRFSLLTVMRSAVMHRPFAYWGLLPIVVIGLYALPVYGPLTDAVTIVAVVTVYAVLVSAVANCIVPRLPQRPRWLGYALTVGLLGIGSPIVILITAGRLDFTTPHDTALGWLMVLNFGVLYPLIGIGAHIGRAQREVLARLRASVTTAEVEKEALRQEEARLRRDIAVALHGGLQADLTAAAMRAQRAIDSGDAAAAQEALREARSLVDGALVTTRQRPASVRHAAEAVARAWAELADVVVTVEVSSEPGPRTVATIEEILLEGVSNAVRHGHAKRIEISVREVGPELQVTITDDGVGVTGEDPGLGAAMFDELAPNAWSLDPWGKGARLSVAIR